MLLNEVNWEEALISTAKEIDCVEMNSNDICLHTYILQGPQELRRE